MIFEIALSKTQEKIFEKKKAYKVGQEERVPDVNNVLEVEMYRS